MRISYIKIALMAMLLPLGACNAVQKTSQKVKDAAGKDVHKEAVLPTDRERIVKPVSAVYTSEDLAKGILKGDWAIETVNGKKTVGEIAPFIKFVPEGKKVYGNNGCNVINATYDYNPADSTIMFSQLLSTMRMCGTEGITDAEVNRALGEAQYYTWSLNEDDYFLTLYNSDREPVMELMHQNFQFLNGTWLVTEIDGEKINVPDMKLVIDVDEGKLHGNTGCNLINGKLDTDMDAANSISFQSIGMTKKACQDMQYETRLVMALEEAMKAKPLKQGKVALIDSQDKVVLLLERTSDK